MENFEIKLEPAYVSETSENRTFYSGNVNNTRGRFNINRRGNSNYNNRNTRQGQYYSNNNSGNQTVNNYNK